jgi:hypothetical protein
MDKSGFLSAAGALSDEFVDQGGESTGYDEGHYALRGNNGFAELQNRATAGPDHVHCLSG